jgi:hypothetical protein
LLLANLGLGFDNVPELDDVILNLLNPNILPADFRVFDLTLLGNFGVRCGRESH